MRSPVRLNIRLHEVSLPVARPVSLRVLRFSWALDLRIAGIAGAASLPLSVVDHDPERPLRAPIVDPLALASGIGALLTLAGLVRSARAARRHKHQKTKQQEDSHGE